MTILHESDLGQPLLAFVFAYYMLAILWAEIRKYHPQVVYTVNTLSQEDRKLVQKGKYYRMLVLAFTSIVLCFALYPVIYKSFIPIKALDTTWANLLGLVILFISLIWIVVTRSDFDSELFRNEFTNTQMKNEELTAHSRKFTIGYLLMFLGITITLANMLSAVLLLIAWLVYKHD